MSAWNPIEAVGSALIAAALAAVGWVLSTFTKRHIESMDKLTTRVDNLVEKVGGIATDMATTKANVEAVRDSGERLEARVTRLEHKGDER